MTDNLEVNELSDYEFMCFYGEVKAVYNCTNRFAEEALNETFFDSEWNRLPFARNYCYEDNSIQKPESFKEMINLATILSCNIPFACVDFYEIEGKPFLGK